MVDISRHIDFLGPSGKTLSVSERSGLQVGICQHSLLLVMMASGGFDGLVYIIEWHKMFWNHPCIHVVYFRGIFTAVTWKSLPSASKYVALTWASFFLPVVLGVA